jgi:hypothetical protein
MAEILGFPWGGWRKGGTGRAQGRRVEGRGHAIRFLWCGVQQPFSGAYLAGFGSDMGSGDDREGGRIPAPDLPALRGDVRPDAGGVRIPGARRPGRSRGRFSGGYICPKAVGLMDIQHDSDRLHQPLRRRNGTWEAAGWDHAVAETVQRLADIRRAHGDDAVAFYVGNPATHSYSATLAALAFAKALNTHNVFSTASVDYLPHTFAAYYNFGNRILIPVPDVDRTQFLLILGANPAVSNGSVMAAPNMARRLKDLRSRGGRLGRGRSPADPHRRPGRHVPADPARDRRLGSLYVHGKVSTQARGYWALRPPN